LVIVGAEASKLKTPAWKGELPSAVAVVVTLFIVGDDEVLKTPTF
jgi:hypothetical protein